MPDWDHLKPILLGAEAAARRLSWTPAAPESSLKIARDREIRLVQNGDQLLDVIIESLERLERKLHDETPAVVDMWNEIKRDRQVIFQPKDEPRLSDIIKRHLDDDLQVRGIIANREVQIHRIRGYEQTDIHVDAIIPGPDTNAFGAVTVIIEVKGCWYHELMTAMKSQLRDSYLRDNRCQHGLYLVGWFNCDKWDTEDQRRRAAPDNSLDEARELFDKQAAELSDQDLKIRAFVLDASLR